MRPIGSPNYRTCEKCGAETTDLLDCGRCSLEVCDSCYEIASSGEVVCHDCQNWCVHKWVDVSTAGPDSGNMDVECSKCGAYKHIPLY